MSALKPPVHVLICLVDNQNEVGQIQGHCNSVSPDSMIIAAKDSFVWWAAIVEVLNFSWTCHLKLLNAMKVHLARASDTILRHQYTLQMHIIINELIDQLLME